MIKFSLLFFWIIQGGCTIQQVRPEDLFGKWKIKDWLFFENLKETPIEREQRMKDYHNCIKSYINIDSTGIKVIGNNSCYFDPCTYDFSKNPHYLKRRIIPDNEYTRQESGSEMIDSNVVGKRFVSYIDKNYSKAELLLIDAGCTQSYGNFTMKICIASKNKIGLFMGEEMIVLERENNRK